MAGYYISSDTKYTEYFELLLQRLEEVKNDVQINIDKKNICGRQYAEITSEERLQKNVITLIKDMIKDIILINYKYIYFRNNLNIAIKDKSLDSLFYTSITLYDREYDIELLNLDKFTDKELSIDSIFHFCINDIIKRWQNVTEILQDNFYDECDREAMLEFIKHIIYSLPSKTSEINIYRFEGGYKFIDNNGKNIANIKNNLSGGEIAAKLMFVSPSAINFYDECDMQTMQFLKNIFNDRIRFFIDK